MKPCPNPKCGNPDPVTDGHYSSDDPPVPLHTVWVECNKCGATGPFAENASFEVAEKWAIVLWDGLPRVPWFKQEE